MDHGEWCYHRARGSSRGAGAGVHAGGVGEREATIKMRRVIFLATHLHLTRYFLLSTSSPSALPFSIPPCDFKGDFRKYSLTYELGGDCCSLFPMKISDSRSSKSSGAYCFTTARTSSRSASEAQPNIVPKSPRSRTRCASIFIMTR